MLFNSVQYFLFLALVLLLFYNSAGTLRKFILLVASYGFYAWWNWKFVPLLLVLTTIDYWAAIWMTRARPERKRAFLLISVLANLSFLCVFKYYNFLADNVAGLIGLPPSAFNLSIVLPLGISFHTLQSISYVVNVYRGEQKPITNPLDYALFICFFPQLVAGPIVRARVFFRDLYHWRPPSREEQASAILLIALGLAKKMAFADNLARVSDSYFNNLAQHPGLLTAWTGSIAFILQVYFDFSGYTDIAIGSAKLLGFHFPVNFNRPFLAASMTEFWRRWHISLSTWLRDYVYIPLATRRSGEGFLHVNLMITMIVAGLWHGASWNFVVWGAYNGVLLSLERAWRVWRRRRPAVPATVDLHALQVCCTFLLFSAGAPFFRLAKFSDAVAVIGQMFHGSPGVILFNSWQIGLIAVSFFLARWEESKGWFERLVTGPVWAYAGAMTLILICLELFGVTESVVPFVYFQF
ncbi:MAG: MBOAT family protein [Acidobacteriota bacterium]|nr:MBOAT family protein [Acidobacteriota bacterium]